MTITIPHRLSRLFTRSAAGLMLAVAGAFAAPAVAQPDPGGFLALSQHDYLHRDMVIFAQGLNLDDGQRMIVESLYEDYRDAFDAGWQRTQERLSELRHGDSSNPQAMLDAVLAPFEQWSKEKQRIKERFEEDVKVLLNPEQLNQWEAFQRRITREKTLPMARLAGENVDLFHVVRELNLDERTAMALEPVLNQYDLAMDEALRRRNQSINDAQRAAFDAIRNQNPAARLGDIERQIRLRIEVRDVNDRFREIIAGYLNEPRKSEFELNALQRGYPRVFAPTPAMRLFREAGRMMNIDAQTKQAIAELNTALMTEMNAHNASILATLQDHEPKAVRNQADIFAARQSGERIERLGDPTHEMIRTRDTRASQFVEQLRDLMGIEEFAKLPGSGRWTAEALRASGDEASGIEGGPNSGTIQRGERPALGSNEPPQRNERQQRDSGGRPEPSKRP